MKRPTWEELPDAERARLRASGLLKPSEAAPMLNVGKTTVTTLCAQHALIHLRYRVPGSTRDIIQIPRAEVERFINESFVPRKAVAS